MHVCFSIGAGLYKYVHTHATPVSGDALIFVVPDAPDLAHNKQAMNAPR